MPGFPGVQNLIDQAESSLKRTLNAGYVNLHPLSGILAMTSTISALSKPGDLVASIHLDNGGHFLTSQIIESIGRRSSFIPFCKESLAIDLETIGSFIKKQKPRLIYLDTSYYLEAYPLKQIRDLVGPETIIVYDASHTLGLIVGGHFQSPLEEGADVITANTHKSFPGPHRGIVAFRDSDFGKSMADGIDTFYSTIHCNQLLALCVAILEMEAFGQEYATATIQNAKSLGVALNSLGFNVRRTSNGEFTQSNQLHVELPNVDRYLNRYRHLVLSGITVNFKDLNGPIMRLGSQEVTRRGMTAETMKAVSDLLFCAYEFGDAHEAVQALSQSHTKCSYSFDSL